MSEPINLLNEREKELINGMIEVQLNHAMRCDMIRNRGMAEKQKVWDMERVDLLNKILKFYEYGDIFGIDWNPEAMDDGESTEKEFISIEFVEKL